MGDAEYRLGLIGRQVTASLSPAIFRWGFAELGLSGTYELYDFEPDEARSFLRSPASVWTGLNVTSPHKDLAYRLAERRSQDAERTRSVNTLSRTGNGITGDNTDVAGFTYALGRRLSEMDRVNLALVIGTGGAARAVLCALRCLLPDASVHVASRDPDQAGMTLAQTIDRSLEDSTLSHEQAALGLSEYDLVVQATPVGGHSNPGYPLPPPLSFKPSCLVIDLNYTPRRTALLDAAEASGARIENGLVMLLAQAAASFRVWTGRDFPLDRAMTDLLPSLQES